MARCAENLAEKSMLAFGLLVTTLRKQRRAEAGGRTSHTSGFGGFCGPGGSVVEGRCNRGSREAAGEEGPPRGGELCSIARGE